MRIFLYCLFFGILGEIGGKLSDKRLCFDQDCKTLLSVGRTKITYNALEPGMLSFRSNRSVKVFSKGAGSNPDLWGVLIDGKRGYVNKNNIIEDKIYIASSRINVEVSNEFIDSTNEDEDKGSTNNKPQEVKPSVDSPAPETADTTASHPAPQIPSHSPSQPSGDAASTVVPSQAKNNFEVVDGTTIWMEEDDIPKINESPSFDNITPSDIQPTQTDRQPAPTASANTNNGSEAEGKAPEIESSVLSPEYQDVKESPEGSPGGPTHTGAPSPTVPQQKEIPPIDSTGAVHGEVVRDVPRTVTLEVQDTRKVAEDPAGQVQQGVPGDSGDKLSISQAEEVREAPVQTEVPDQKPPVAAPAVPDPASGTLQSDENEENSEEDGEEEEHVTADYEDYEDAGEDEEKDESEDENEEETREDEGDDDFDSTLNELESVLNEDENEEKQEDSERTEQASDPDVQPQEEHGELNTQSMAVTEPTEKEAVTEDTDKDITSPTPILSVNDVTPSPIRQTLQENLIEETKDEKVESNLIQENQVDSSNIVKSEESLGDDSKADSSLSEKELEYMKSIESELVFNSNPNENKDDRASATGQEEINGNADSEKSQVGIESVTNEKDSENEGKENIHDSNVLSKQLEPVPNESIIKEEDIEKNGESQDKIEEEYVNSDDNKEETENSVDSIKETKEIVDNKEKPLEASEEPVDKAEESEGFFSSWLGSSETKTENIDTEDKAHPTDGTVPDISNEIVFHEPQGSEGSESVPAQSVENQKLEAEYSSTPTPSEYTEGSAPSQQASEATPPPHQQNPGLDPGAHHQPTYDPSQDPYLSPEEPGAGGQPSQPSSEHTTENSGTAYSQPSDTQSYSTESDTSYQAGNDPAYQAGNDPAFQAGNDPAFQAGNDPTYQAGNDPAYQVVNDPAFQTGNDPAYQAGNDPAYQAGNDPAYQAGNDPSYQAGNDPSFQAGNDPTYQVGIDPSNQAGYDPSYQAGNDPSYTAGNEIYSDGSNIYSVKDQYSTQDSQHSNQEWNLSNTGSVEESRDVNLPNQLPSDDMNQPYVGLVGEDVIPGGQHAPDEHAPFPDPGERLDHHSAPVTGFLMDYVPEWLHEAAHEAGGINGDRAILLVIIAVTMVMVHLITSCISRSGREKPLLAKLADLDRKLFQATNEVLILRKEASEKTTSSDDSVPSAQVRELEIQLEQANIEKDQLSNHTREIQARCSQFEEEMYRAVEMQQAKEKEVEVYQQEKEAALEEARMAQEMVEEMINSRNNNQSDNQSNEKLMELVQKLQKQLESQQDVLKQYEPRLKKKEKEAKELNKEMKQLRADLANANLAKDKLNREMEEHAKVAEEKSKILENVTKNEEEWKSLTDLLQSQLDEKCEEHSQIDTELSSIKSRLNIYKNELEEKEEQVEVLQETINQIKNKKGGKMETEGEEEAGGWDVEDEGWEVEDAGMDEEVDAESSAEIAKLKVTARRATNNSKKLEGEIDTIQKNLSETKSKLEERNTECELLRSARDETVKELVDTNRRLEVLEQFFNKKEAELQKQLGLQSAKFGDVSTSADTTAKKLISVTEELETTKGAMKVLKCELEEQEKSLKAAVALQEKKAHENWVAARQAERKLADLQTEISTLRNRLTVTETRSQTLEQEKTDLQNTIQNISQVKPEPVNGHTSGPPTESIGSETNSIADPASLPPLPGLPMSTPMTPSLPGLALPTLPNMMVPPMFGAGLPTMIDNRPPPLGRMSPPRERERSDVSFRSSSPHRRDYSPSTRSERRTGRRHSPRRPSPTRSDRGYYRDSSTDRSFRHDDRYDRRSSRDEYDARRDYDFDRRRNGDDYNRRRDYDGRRGDDYLDRRGRDYMMDAKPGPKTSSPLEPAGRNFAV